jgi:hypothetical protein
MKHASCNVTFVGDFFSLTHFVEIDLEEPSFANLDNDQLEEVAIDMATKNLRYHYGWEMKDISWETTVEFDYLPTL